MSVANGPLLRSSCGIWRDFAAGCVLSMARKYRAINGRHSLLKFRTADLHQIGKVLHKLIVVAKTLKI